MDEQSQHGAAYSKSKQDEQRHEGFIPSGTPAQGSPLRVRRCVALRGVRPVYHIRFIVRRYNDVNRYKIAVAEFSAVNIPPTIQNLPVTAIGANIFTTGMGSVTSLTIPSNVTSIQATAFYNLANLRSVTFLGTIPLSGFQMNSFPNNDLRAKFYATDKTNGTPGTYTKSGTTWTLAPAGTTTAAAQPNSEKDFEYFTTADKKGIIIDQYIGKAEAVRIPDRINNLPVVEIGSSAFSGPHLTTVTIPAAVTKITFGTNVFIGAASVNAASKTALQKAGYTGAF